MCQPAASTLLGPQPAPQPFSELTSLNININLPPDRQVLSERAILWRVINALAVLSFTAFFALVTLADKRSPAVLGTAISLITYSGMVAALKILGLQNHGMQLTLPGVP